MPKPDFDRDALLTWRESPVGTLWGWALPTPFFAILVGIAGFAVLTSDKPLADRAAGLLPVLFVGQSIAWRTLRTHRYAIADDGLASTAWQTRDLVKWSHVARLELRPNAARLTLRERGRESDPLLLMLPKDPAVRAEAVALLRSHLSETAFA